MLLNSVNIHQVRSEAVPKSKNNENINTNIEGKPTCSDVNLIDLLDDDNVTPQESHENHKDKQISDYQLKMLEEFCRTSALTSQHNDQQEAEFRSFFDKYESDSKQEKSTLNYEDLLAFEQKPERNQRFADNPYASDKKQFAYNLYNSIDDIDGTSKLPKFKEPQETEHENGEIKINEDLIDEVLFEQHLEKQQLATATLPKSNEMKTAFVDTTQSANTFMDSKEPKDDYSNIFDEIITKNKMAYFEKSTSENRNTAKFTNPSTVILNDGKDCTNQTKLEQKALTEELVTKYDVKYLEAVKKIEKTFQKRNVLKSDSEKAKLTPGPTLYEKTVVLPQIMQRLKHMEDKSEVKMKLILEAGPPTTPSIDSHAMKSPLNTLGTKQVLQDKDIVKPTRRLSYDGPCSTLLDNPTNIKIGLLTPKSQSINNTLKTPLRNMKDINVALKSPVSENSNDDITVLRPPAMFLTDCNKQTPKSQSINNNLKTPLTHIKNIKSALKSPVSENSNDDISVLRPPAALLTDCNRQRLIAHETGKLFNNFVRAGSFYAP